MLAWRLCPPDIGAGSRAHVRPILVDVFDACLTAVPLAGDRPAGRNFGGCGPERILALVIDQDHEGSAWIVERVAHVSRSCFEVPVAVSRCRHMATVDLGRGLRSSRVCDQAAAARA